MSIQIKDYKLTPPLTPPPPPPRSDGTAYIYATLCFFGGVVLMKFVDYCVGKLESLDLGDNDTFNDDASNVVELTATATATTTTTTTTSPPPSTSPSPNKNSGDQNTHHIHMHKGCCPVDASGEIDTWQALADKEIKTLEKRRARSNSADHNDSDDGNSNSNSNGAIIRKPETQLTLDIELGEDDSLDDGESAEDRNQKKLVRMGLNTALAIGIHNFPEGLATFVAALDDPSVGISLAVAIAIHNIPEGLCVAIPIYYATGSKKKAFWWAMLSGATEPIGALIGWGILQGSVGETAYGVLFGFVAGMMVMICLHELIPTAHRYDPEDRVVTNSAVCGMAVMAISLCLFVA